MRKPLFAVVLVAASFAGGAVVNGPGLRWARSIVLNRMGLDDEPEGRVDAVDLEPHAPAPTAAIPPRPTTTAVPSEEPELTKAPAVAATIRKASPAPENAGVIDPPAAVAAAAPDPPVMPPAPDGGLPPLEPPTPLTTSRERERDAVALAKAEGGRQRGREFGPARAADDPKDQDAPVRLASLANPAVAEAETTPPSTAAVPPEPGDWAEVRRSLRTLGVSRYGIDGEPGGRVRFHCVIPLAGRRAVGQHFEAEGDDELQAARAALKRIALWRATESGPPAP